MNLICVEDGIDSSKDAGKLMISVRSAVAEIERENIRVQTMEGRMQKAREGKWNGGFAPYGYSLIDGKLEVNEEEAVAIRMIFDQYVNTDLGANGIAKYLENHGIHKIARQNGKNPLFDAALIRRIIQNPVYSGKISYGRRRTEKVHGTRNEYRQVKKDDYLLVDGLHEALVSEEVWEQAQVKVAAQAKKYEKVNRDKREKIHLLSGILKCPVCGAGMYGNKSIKKRKDGSNYKDFYYYGCKHRNMTRGHKCDYKKQVHEEMLDASVAEVISKLVSNPKFSDLIRNKINMEVDTSALDQEIENYKIQLRKLYHNKDTILSDMDSLDYEDKHYQRRKDDDDNDSTPSAGGDPKEFTDDIPKDTKTIKCSTTDPESGWFRKGEHKNVFAYAIETACDKNGWILGYTINPGNQHDSRTFKGLYDKIKNIGIETLVADAGYKTPAIAKLLIDDGIKPLLPYKRPMTKDGFFKKYEYVYDEYYDCYICPNNKTLTYRTTNKDGYREYKSCGAACAECPYLSQCTESRDHVKTVTRHIWEPYMEICEDIRQMLGMKDLYAQRKETIERIFGTAKENHGFRYTQMYGKARMEMKVGLTYACMNLKKLAKIKEKRGLLKERKTLRNLILYKISFIKEKLLWDVNSRATLSTV